jgi:MoaA/NifB/PqqE/SkfB family radical SAM enzyme
MGGSVGTFVKKLARAASLKGAAMLGRVHSLERTLAKIDLKPPSINIELTNICNANCVFCGYQYQERAKETMSDEVFERAVAQFVACGGGDVFLTPIVGEATVDPKFLSRVRYLRAQRAIRDIRVITNAILLDRFGMDDVVRSGLSGVFISTAGFEEEMYKRIYRSTNYNRMKNNVLSLLEARDRLGAIDKLEVTIGLRTDRTLASVMTDPDFQPILKYKPKIDFTWSYVDFGGKIKAADLKGVMQLRVLSKSAKREPCKNLYDGPTILPDGEVLICSCASAMDAIGDLSIGNVMKASLKDIWGGALRRNLIAQFKGEQPLNRTCAGCTSYRNLDFYRTGNARRMAAENQARASGADPAQFNDPSHPRLHD